MNSVVHHPEFTKAPILQPITTKLNNNAMHTDENPLAGTNLAGGGHAPPSLLRNNNSSDLAQGISGAQNGKRIEAQRNPEHIAHDAMEGSAAPPNRKKRRRQRASLSQSSGLDENNTGTAKRHKESRVKVVKADDNKKDNHFFIQQNLDSGGSQPTGTGSQASHPSEPKPKPKKKKKQSKAKTKPNQSSNPKGRSVKSEPKDKPPVKLRRSKRKATEKTVAQQQDSSGEGKDKAKGKKSKRKKEKVRVDDYPDYCELPLDKIRRGMPGILATRQKTKPRTCRILDVDFESEGFWPIRVKYTDDPPDYDGPKCGWIDPKHIFFEKKYSTLKITPNFECFHRPTYKGILLPPQKVSIKETDPDDEVKNALIRYVNPETKIFGRSITLREGWINDRDLWMSDEDDTPQHIYEAMLAEAEDPERLLRDFNVGSMAYHVANVDGKDTEPLEVMVMDRDDSGTPRNCKIRYMDEEYVRGNSRVRLLGGWVPDMKLTPMTKKMLLKASEDPASAKKLYPKIVPGKHVRYTVGTIWLHVPPEIGVRQTCRIIEVHPNDLEHSVRIEYIRDNESSPFIVGRWVNVASLHH